ncbi:DEAD/DEAH box helicase family protein [Burkholderia cenocepacia]|uniref:DEAD/DEAH box helicase family protein n=1 Tax=Burkholderia cenocepacia TaxID=95486 RepID=UPI002873F5FF|nr:DEAD/DEAH box helicase family protein [Burkholderia cenocepacia]MDS0850643.1 DEAD/DEAH box helicase family protein [Burkholderia cenocepacia]
MKIDFGKMAKSRGPGAPSTLGELFDQLDRKATHQSLRTVQSDAFAALDQQLQHKDVVLKLSTGSGKTLVGLVYAEFMRRRYPGEPVLYVCPTNQLVEQVVENGPLIGLTVDTFPTKGRPHAAFEGRSILACTYDRLVNARNVFESDNVVPAAIILDDVHAGIDRIRSSYSVSIPDDAYETIRALFASICEPSDPKIWRGILNNEPETVFEVPFWIWKQQHEAVAKILDNYSDEKEVLFHFGNISRYFEYMRLCISGARAELSCYVPPIEDNSSYAGAKHRLFMSASVKDGAALIRDLDCDPAALRRVIEISSDRGAGERMILPLSLIDPGLGRKEIGPICETLATRANVVILTSSRRQADAWAEFGATVCAGDHVDVAVADLRRTPKGRFYAFAQRFDGVDLADDACRILVIDGSPAGDRLADQVDAERQRNSPGHNVRTINRFEQALGRAVRSSADFAAILLVGHDVAALIGRKDVKDLLEANSREQIELGKELAEALKQEGNAGVAVRSALDALLSRDEGWKEAHRERIAGARRVVREPGRLTINEEIAEGERDAWIKAKARNHQGSMAALQNQIDKVGLHPRQKSELLYRQATYANGIDSSKALEIFRVAFQINSDFPRPVELADKKYTKVDQQGVLLSNILSSYSSANAAIARVEELRARLAYSGDAERVEQALADLGEILGSAASRPEKETGRGPDVLWRFDNLTFCIEAKNEKTSKIFKADAEQLLLSKQWCKDQLNVNADEVVAIFASNSRKFDRVEDSTFGPLFLTEADVLAIADRLKAMLSTMSFDGPLFNDKAKIAQLLAEHKLTAKALKAFLEK